MGGRMNFAPRVPTIIVALAFILIGLLGTFAGVLPPIAGQPSEVIGAWAFVVAAVVLFAGMIFEGI
jgi:hypothetical protein